MFKLLILSQQPDPSTVKSLQPHSFMGSHKEDCLGSVRFPPTPLPSKKKKKKKWASSTSASRLLLGWHWAPLPGDWLFCVLGQWWARGPGQRGTQGVEEEKKQKEWHRET